MFNISNQLVTIFGINNGQIREFKLYKVTISLTYTNNFKK